MCLVTFALGEHAGYPFVLVANRDERYGRASAGLHFWDDQPDLLAGRDLEHGGTWLGLTRAGRFATLTNHPFTDWQPQEAVSRGNLVSDFLNGELSAQAYLDVLRANRQRYEGYHLIFGTLATSQTEDGPNQAAGLWLYSNVEDRVLRLDQGLHSVGNTYDDLTRHKESRSKNLLAAYLDKELGQGQDALTDEGATRPLGEWDASSNMSPSSDQLSLDELIRIFQDRQPASHLTVIPDQLPLEVARNNSSIFIKGDYFGTVGSTVLLIDHDGWVQAKEVRYNQAGIIETTEKKFKLGPSTHNLRPSDQVTNEVSE